MSDTISTNGSGRTPGGQFAPGNRGGPGRPRRAVEADYLRTLSDAITLDDWREIVKSAVDAAKAGDDKARVWLANYLIGREPPTLRELAVNDALGVSEDQLIDAEAHGARIDAEHELFVARLNSKGPPPLAIALQKRLDSERETREAAEAAERRAQREARKAAKASGS